MTTDDARIRQRVRQGDSDAFAALFDEHARLVYNHALRLTGDRSTAEEVLSETFLAAWRRRSAVEPDGGSLRPWLLGIATRQAMGATRSAGRRRRFLADQPAPRAGEDISDQTVFDAAGDLLRESVMPPGTAAAL